MNNGVKKQPNYRDICYSTAQEMSGKCDIDIKVGYPFLKMMSLLLTMF